MTSKHKNSGPITFGLDIGIASVGWAVLGANRIIGLGVRCFDKAETAEKGESLNLVRRMARLTRRRLRRRAWRLTKLARLLKREGLIADALFFKKQTPITLHAENQAINLWELRVQALDRCLIAEEWARVIYHVCKHRGFHWTSRAELKAADKDNEGGRVKQGLAGTKKLMQEKNYDTAAQMIVNEFPDAQRNKAGDYSKALSRELLDEELKTLFERQRDLGNVHADVNLETSIRGLGDKKSGLFWEQEPALSGQSLLKMLGKCTFEKGEYRAPKASFTAERHVWMTRLNNLRIIVDGHSRSLSESERRAVLMLPYEKTSLSYHQLRAALIKTCSLPDTFKFGGLSYPAQSSDESKNPEDEKVVKLIAWQTLRKCFSDANLDAEWMKISTSALEGDPTLLDQIAWVLSVFKDDDEVQTELSKLDIPSKDTVIDALLEVRFDKFSNLSLKALRKILPHMAAGQRYDEACANAGYHHSQTFKAGEGKFLYLPSLYSGRDERGSMKFNENLDVPRNPVVLRSLNQARKVVNALIREYGSPHEIHIEMARDLSRSSEDRRKVKDAQSDFRIRNEKDRETFAEEFSSIGGVSGRDFEKWQLYREQQGKCAYSLETLDITRLLEHGYVEVDHAIPYSRSYDDSKNNRVLVLTRENRNKGNMTPYEYLGGKNDSVAWREFSAYVNVNKSYRQAKRNRLLRKDFDEKSSREFMERNLNDTRYICRFFKNYVEEHLQLHEDSDAKRCVVLSGQMTSFLRMRWGLAKVRKESDRHHAMDAVVVAACGHGMVKRLSDYSRRKELENARSGFVDPATGEVLNPEMLDKLEKHFPLPWHGFRDELLARLSVNSVNILQEELAKLGTYPPDEIERVKPLFVSRAPQRRNGGAVHKETIYGDRRTDQATSAVSQKVSVTTLKNSDIEQLIEPHRNERLYTALQEWVSQRDDREKTAKDIEKRAKTERRPLDDSERSEIETLRALPRKPDKSGNPTGPIVRSVTMIIEKLSGIPIRSGIAKNDSMLRVDIFKSKIDKKYYVVPVYVHHVASGLPMLAIIAYKDESAWTKIDENFDFLFSLYPNDLARVTLKSESILGYYAGCDRSTGAINLWAPDRSEKVGKNGLIRGIGVKTAMNIEKFNVDVLGNIYPAPPDIRRELA
ncbi:MAG: type II CRISPR RNA-guided endonuclease Cas9 [Gammaproteobacteria bacterium]|nr:type II CRISPR RNA-guided endonuclease Cas9 [Gammaproteobacteria bacterium]